jgi:hypothetical protein
MTFAALVITAFELPVRWPTTVLHLLNSVYFAVLPLVLLHLKSEYYDPGSNGPSDLLGGTMLGGAVAYGLAALGCAVAVLRRARDVVTITGLVTAVLMTVGSVLILVTEVNNPGRLSEQDAASSWPPGSRASVASRVPRIRACNGKTSYGQRARAG